MHDAMDHTSRSHQPDFLLLEETPRDHETKKRINEMECHAFQGQRRRAEEIRKRRVQSTAHRHPHAVEISTIRPYARLQEPALRIHGYAAARRRRVPDAMHSREGAYQKPRNAMKTHYPGDAMRPFHGHLHTLRPHPHRPSHPVNKARG